MRYAGVVELRRNRLLAAWGGKRPGWIDEAIPEELDDQSRSAWLRAAFRDSGMPKGRVLLVLPRREGVLLRLDIEAPDGATLADLHGMARVRLGAQSTIDAQSCVMDVVPTTGTGYTVSAVPGDVADRTRDEMRQAGRAIAAMTTRSAGLGIMAQEMSVALVIVAGERDIELAVVRHGVPVLVRQLNRNGDVSGDAAKIVSEAHRAETSARMLAGLEPLERIVLQADGVIAPQVKDLIQKELSVPLAGYDASVPGMPAELWPLMAMALSKRPPVFWLRRVRPPRGLQVPAVRIAAGLSALAAILLIGSALVLSRQKAGLEKRVSALRNELVQLQASNREHLREEARLIHLQSWLARDTQWTTEIASLTGIIPERGVVIDRLIGSESREVSFAPDRSGQTRKYEGGRWSRSAVIEFDLHASVKDRGLVREFRQRLIDDPRFDVESKGPELPDRLVFRVTSTPTNAEAGR